MNYDRTNLGYHGCDASVANRLLAGETAFAPSENAYDWLGRGIYFWEFGPDRALRWAELTRDRDAKRPPSHRPPVERPAVVGAVLKLGTCLDLLDTEATRGLASVYPAWVEAVRARGEALPANSADLLRHNRDCAVLNSFIPVLEAELGRPYDSVRGCFVEGGEVYEGSGIMREAHIQVAVRRPEACLVGLFRTIFLAMAQPIAPPDSPPALSSPANVYERAAARAKAMGPDALWELIVKVGVYTPEGRLTPEYGGDERDAAE